MILSLYRGFGVVGAPLIWLYLARRRARGKEDRERFGERLGKAGKARPSGPLVWLHAASVGESLSLLPLIERLAAERPEIQLLLTTGTITSAALMAERLPNGVIHQYVPVDRVSYVHRFLDHWRPDLALWSESEFWPNLLIETARRKVPLVLINGRVSPKSYAGWQRFPGLIKAILASFSLCLGQTETDANRLRQLGASLVRSVGNLKFAVKPLPASDADLEGLATALAERPRWFAASTHPGEENILWRVHQSLTTERPDLLTIIAPRHPARGVEIAAQLRQLGARVARRSQSDPITPETQIYLADTLGEMGLFFRQCDLVFMGKSFVDMGGQNPLEAAKLDCCLLHGPYMWNFQEITERLLAVGGSVEVADETALATTLAGFFDDRAAARQVATNAREFALSQSGVLDAVCAELTPFLDSLSPHEVTK